MSVEHSSVGIHSPVGIHSSVVVHSFAGIHSFVANQPSLWVAEFVDIVVAVGIVVVAWDGTGVAESIVAVEWVRIGLEA